MYEDWMRSEEQTEGHIEQTMQKLPVVVVGGRKRERDKKKRVNKGKQT